ncbi:cell division protein DivIVA [Plantactinospora sp. WMMC1484]|uniref:cell division protein DivIVA n=1 Tax=Plantactinospora sp. WMMC1484 TaxID=3404122 RepID=UPI003BF4EF3A
MAQVYRGGLPSGGSPDWLTPHEIRTRQFTSRRDGVDREQVRAFQLRLADEISALLRELTMTLTENARLRRALRDRPGRQPLTETAPDRPRGNTGRW